LKLILLMTLGIVSVRKYLAAPSALVNVSFGRGNQ
jgi:hypothetical protein